MARAGSECAAAGVTKAWHPRQMIQISPTNASCTVCRGHLQHLHGGGGVIVGPVLQQTRSKTVSLYQLLCAMRMMKQIFFFLLLAVFTFSHVQEALAQSSSRPGDGGRNTAWVQQTLNGMGYDCGVIDGSTGAKTRACIQAFQRANGLEATGAVNEATYEKMLDLLEPASREAPEVEQVERDRAGRPARQPEPRQQPAPRERPAPEPRVQSTPSAFSRAGYKDPGTATLYSIGIPGGGQLWAGETKKGALLLGTAVAAPVVGYVIAASTCSGYGYDCSLTPIYLGSAAALGAWIYGIIDAGDAAERHNARNGLTDARIRVRPKMDRQGGEKAYGFQLSMRF